MNGVELFELTLALLGIVFAFQWLAQKLGLPPATALLVGGGLLAFVPGLPPIELNPELVLILFLPPLLMDGAYYTAYGRFRRHLPGILSLAVGAAAFTTLVVGVVVHWLMPQLPWAACFALGAIVSPPDAVSARAVLQHITLPRRLTALLEGESLLNDATGLVMFRFAVAATLSGVFHAGDAVLSFFYLALGGAAVGLAMAGVWIYVVRRLQDQTLIITASILLSWFAYIAGEKLHVSGVIATVSAGLVLGWYQHVIFPARVRLRASAFSHIMVYVLEALVFILIGFSLRGVIDRIGHDGLADMLVPLLAVIAAVTVSRFVWVYGSDVLLHVLRAAGVRRAEPLGWRQATVLGWAGMRGVVTLAVALSLPESMPARDFMLVTAFAVILVTVVVQGGSLGWLIRGIQPADRDPPPPLGLPACEAVIARARHAAVERHAYDADGTLIHPMLLEMARKRMDATQRYAEDTQIFMAGFQSHFEGMLLGVAAARAELLRLHRSGQIEDDVLHNLERDLDVEEMGIILQRDG